MQILIADDDPIYRTLLMEMLSSWGYEVTVASNGLETWDALKKPDGPKMVILDWLMPEMDGFEVCKKVRQDPATHGVYILLMTGSKQREDIIKVLVAGADDYLLKPFEPLDLKIHLRTGQRIIDMQAELDHARGSSTNKQLVP